MTAQAETLGNVTHTPSATTQNTGEAANSEHANPSAVWRIVSQHAATQRHKSWPARRVLTQGSLHIFEAVFTDTVQHTALGLIPRGTASTEYFWADRWYNVFRFATPAGALRNYYCNLAVPPTLDGNTLIYQDLDLDVLVSPDGHWQVLDEAEFQHYAQLYQYPQAWHAHTQAALAELIHLITTRQFPFTELPDPP